MNVCRVIELATVEPQISLHEQNSLTPASGMFACLSVNSLLQCLHFQALSHMHAFWAALSSCLDCIVLCRHCKYYSAMWHPGILVLQSYYCFLPFKLVPTCLQQILVYQLQLLHQGTNSATLGNLSMLSQHDSRTTCCSESKAPRKASSSC